MKKSAVLLEAVHDLKSNIARIEYELGVLRNSRAEDFRKHNPYINLNHYLNRLCMTSRYLQRTLLDSYSVQFKPSNSHVKSVMTRCMKSGWPSFSNDQTFNPFYALDTDVSPDYPFIDEELI